jgi:hypothetical protein
LNAVKVLVAIAILCPAVFADGEMGSGGFTGSDVTPVPVKSERTLEDGEMGSGGRLAGGYLDYVILTINDYVDSMI